ncbi:MAG: hypothetical protein ACI304_03545 [Lepagella sp.]
MRDSVGYSQPSCLWRHSLSTVRGVCQRPGFLSPTQSLGIGGNADTLDALCSKRLPLIAQFQLALAQPRHHRSSPTKAVSW